MLNPNYGRAVTAFGIGTIVLWLSYVAYLPPFVRLPNVRGLTEEAWKAREFVQEKYRSQQDMEKKLNRALYVAYAKDYALIVLGISAGFLLLAKRRSGRYLAMALAAIMIASRVVAAIMHVGGVSGWFKIIYGFMLLHSPIMIVHKDIIAPLFFIYTIWFLSKKSVSTYFFHGV